MQLEEKRQDPLRPVSGAEGLNSIRPGSMSASRAESLKRVQSLKASNRVSQRRRNSAPSYSAESGESQAERALRQVIENTLSEGPNLKELNTQEMIASVTFVTVTPRESN
eukprot:5234-Rhodomonas_salina.3